MTIRSEKLVYVGAALLALSAAGCFTRFNTHVRLSPDLVKDPQRIPAIEVHLIGVSQSEYQQWYHLDVTGYFDPQKVQPPADKKVIVFGASRPTSEILRCDDPVVRKWQEAHVAYLFVLAHLPGTWQSKPGPADPRRLILRLNSDFWPDYCWGKKTLHVEVNAGGIRLFYLGGYKEDALPQ